MDYLRRELGDDIHFFNVKDGWGPLCELLEVDVPDTAFPQANDGVAIQQEVTRAIRFGLILWGAIVGGIIGMISLIWASLIQ